MHDFYINTVSNIHYIIIWNMTLGTFNAYHVPVTPTSIHNYPACAHAQQGKAIGLRICRLSSVVSKKSPDMEF